MNISDVKQLPVKERFLYWVRERYAIRQRRLSGNPWPWTDDEILRDWRFCNVRRIDDKVSQWLLNEWYTPYLDHPNMLLACILARQLNTIESLQAVGFPETWKPKEVYRILDDRQQAGMKNYAAAYVVTGAYGPKGQPKKSKAYNTVYTVVDFFYKNNYAEKIDTSSMEKTWLALRRGPGQGSFFTGQVVADLRWGLTGEWEDRNTWAPMGPGSERGMNRLHERPIDYKIPQHQFLDELRVFADEVREMCRDNDLEELAESLELIDVQSVMCEGDKFLRIMNDEGRPKQRYFPPITSPTLPPRHP